MRFDTYEVHKTVQAQRFRHRERDHSHRRALKGAERTDGFISRIASGLERAGVAALRRRGYIAYDAHVLTDKVCRLADGSVGRIAIRESDGAVIEVCVPA